MLSPPDEERGYNLVLEDPDTGEQMALPVSVSLRALEVLGSAGKFYGVAYLNSERPLTQLENRKRVARETGEALWDAIVEVIGIEAPQRAAVPPLHRRLIRHLTGPV